MLATESDEDGFRLLTTNVTLNNLPQVVLEQRAVGADGGGIDELGLSALERLLAIADAQPARCWPGPRGRLPGSSPRSTSRMSTRATRRCAALAVGLVAIGAGGWQTRTQQRGQLLPTTSTAGGRGDV